MTKLTILSLFWLFFSTNWAANAAQILGAFDERFAQKSETNACSSSFMVIDTKTNRLRSTFLPPAPPSSPNTHVIPDFHATVVTKIVAVRNEWEAEWMMEVAASNLIAQRQNIRRMNNELRKALL
jgi:hypothetical protein